MNEYIMPSIHKLGIEITAVTQISLHEYGEFLIWISNVFEPRYCYFLFFPMLFPFNRTAGIQVLWATAITEWLNHIYKWYLFGERPYWWVHENSNQWDPYSPPVIQQFPNTCETGPGSPSGHVMINSAALFVFVRGVLEVWRNVPLVPIFSSLVWSLYAVIVICIAISRVYIAAHFPHQCLAGMICGVILGVILSTSFLVARIKKKWHYLMALGTFLVAMTSYFVILGLGIDPNWTIPLAKKWCSRPEWVHLTTTPFFMMWRYTSTLLGIGLAMFSHEHLKSSVIENANLFIKTIIAAIGVFVALICEGFISNGPSIFIVYATESIVHVTLPVLVISVVPFVLQKKCSVFGLRFKDRIGKGCDNIEKVPRVEKLAFIFVRNIIYKY